MRSLTAGIRRFVFDVDGSVKSPLSRCDMNEEKKVSQKSETKRLDWLFDSMIVLVCDACRIIAHPGYDHRFVTLRFCDDGKK